jgi:hypothetical protein
MKYLMFFLGVFVLEAAPSTRQSILNKLNNTVIEDIVLDDLTIEEVIKVLHIKSNNEINFLYIRNPSAGNPNVQSTNNIPQIIDPITGVPVNPFPLQPIVKELEIPRIKNARVSLKNITLKQLLDISTLFFSQPMRYVVTDFGVVFLHRKEGELLLTRTYRINPNIFNNRNKNGNK